MPGVRLFCNSMTLREGCASFSLCQDERLRVRIGCAAAAAAADELNGDDRVAPFVIIPVALKCETEYHPPGTSKLRRQDVRHGVVDHHR